jgi:hypothetical protein
MLICSIIEYQNEVFMEIDTEMTETLQQDFPLLNEPNRKKVVEMTKFLILTQNTIVPGFLEEKGIVVSIGAEKERPETMNRGSR